MKTQAQGVLVGNYKQCITNKRHASTNTKTNTLQQPNPAPQQEQTAGKKKLQPRATTTKARKQ
jgi:hypothetical protein